jgi:hypothetical protein
MTWRIKKTQEYKILDDLPKKTENTEIMSKQQQSLWWHYLYTDQAQSDRQSAAVLLSSSLPSVGKETCGI